MQLRLSRTASLFLPFSLYQQSTHQINQLTVKSINQDSATKLAITNSPYVCCSSRDRACRMLITVIARQPPFPQNDGHTVSFKQHTKYFTHSEVFHQKPKTQYTSCHQFHKRPTTMSVDAATSQMANTTLNEPTATAEGASVGAGGDKPINASQNEAVIASAAEGRRLYIGNLAYATTEGELKDFFKDYLVYVCSCSI